MATLGLVASEDVSFQWLHRWTDGNAGTVWGPGVVSEAAGPGNEALSSLERGRG